MDRAVVIKGICTQCLHLVVEVVLVVVVDVEVVAVVFVVGSLVECSGHEHNGFTSLDDVFAIPVDRMFDLLFTDSQMYLDFIKARKTFGPYTNHLPTIYVFITCCDVMLSWLQIYRRNRGHRKWMARRIKCATSATHSLSTTPSVPRRRPPPKNRCAHHLTTVQQHVTPPSLVGMYVDAFCCDVDLVRQAKSSGLRAHRRHGSVQQWRAVQRQLLRNQPLLRDAHEQAPHAPAHHERDQVPQEHVGSRQK